MEIRRDYRPWDALMPDILGLVLKRLSLRYKLTVVPSVCKSWEKAIKGPYCWQEIDIKKWSKYHWRKCVDRMLIMLIGRSSGLLQKLSVSGLRTESSFSLIGDNAKNLLSLRLQGSVISNSMMAQIAPKLSNLTSLDISCCYSKNGFNAKAIEAIGKHCKQLTNLQRNFDEHEWNDHINHLRDDEAFAIAATMPQLKSLELAFMRLTTEGVLRILAKCYELEFLDIRGCYWVKLDEKFLKKLSKLKVMRPEDDYDSDEEIEECGCVWHKYSGDEYEHWY